MKILITGTAGRDCSVYNDRIKEIESPANLLELQKKFGISFFDIGIARIDLPKYEKLKVKFDKSYCSYYNALCNKDDEYGCYAVDCCILFSDSEKDSCARGCLIKADSEGEFNCASKETKQRNTCRKRAHIGCYIACEKVNLKRNDEPVIDQETLDVIAKKACQDANLILNK